MRDITPPPELVLQWAHDANLSGAAYYDLAEHWEYEQHIANRAAQWGADQELEACCEWLDHKNWWGESNHLRAARRPKPPSLKQQALLLLSQMEEECEMTLHASTIRRALEALPDE
jgi:hypothetical protein